MKAKKIDMRTLISRILLWGGVLLMLSAALYEGMSFPWALYLKGREAANAAVLPDPPPPSLLEEGSSGGDLPPVAHVGNDEEEGESPPDIESLPSPDTLLSAGGKKGRVIDTARLKYMGVLKIPCLSVSNNIYGGTDADVLLSGIGHVTGTAGIGQKGNCVLSAHRNYISMHPFRHLDKLREGDRIVITYNDSVYEYSVFDSFIVGADETWVMEKMEEEPNVLTLITCHPVISPVNRLIIRARPAS